MRLKSLFIYCMTLLLAAGSIPVAQAEEVSIGTKTDLTTNDAPVCYFFYYSKVQMIYRADELNIPAGSVISALSFQYKSVSKNITGDLQIDMGETSQSEFSENVYVPGLANYYNGANNMDFVSSNQELTVTYTLDNDYIYEGGNLIIDVNNALTKRSGYVKVPFFAEATGSNTVLSLGKDAGLEGTAARLTHRPILTVTYTPGEISSEPVLNLMKDNVDFGFLGVNQTQTQEVSVRNRGTGELIISGVDQISAPFSVQVPETPIAYGETAPIGFAFNPTSEGIHEQTVTLLSNGGSAQITLKGEAYSETAYFEHFDALSLKPVPSGWRSSDNAYEIGRAACRERVLRLV